MNYYLGFDGGGTKTQCVVIDEHDREEQCCLLRVFRKKDFSEIKYIQGSSYKSAIENEFELR